MAQKVRVDLPEDNGLRFHRTLEQAYGRRGIELCHIGYAEEASLRTRQFIRFYATLAVLAPMIWAALAYLNR